MNKDCTVLKCWHCADYPERRCPRCSGTGSVFWVDGRAYPYTEEGERRAGLVMRRSSRTQARDVL